ncbi:cytosolic fe-s cluster assembly factor nubp1 [Anaeramoeba ignava]|uniref:Cytosolic fe-s cluster assembly factor nubp1 n=1 Tax=Anaeramoeba ignava TaxID=1746090 RepID=A0A9Q0R8G2_ANAIG|nr:cytosolic fe-s cluster assembly factor nubp1 [Anaeramoeba ignava]
MAFSCPAVSEKNVGNHDACKTCPNYKVCMGARQEAAELKQIKERFENVKHIILVLSGKGGVGKSTIAAQLAYSLASQDFKVGVLDVDITGPSIPKMFGLEDERIHETFLGWSPVFNSDNIAVMSIAFLLSHPENAVIWRGPKKNGLIKQFVRDVYWDELDYLIVDTPPGTSDEHLSIASFLEEKIDGAILVTTPQEVSLLDVRREVTFCKKANVNIIGVVENMSSFICSCGHESVIFKPTTGGAEKMCQEMNLKLLGKLPLDISLRESCDLGISFFNEVNESKAIRALREITETIKKEIENKKEKKEDKKEEKKEEEDFDEF